MEEKEKSKKEKKRMEEKEEIKKEKRRMEEKEEKKVKIGGGEKKKKKQKQQPEGEEGFIQFQLRKMTRKRSSHQDHLHLHAPKKNLKHQHPTTCPKLERCKNPPNDKCENDIGKENFGFASLNLDVMELIFNRLNDTVTRIRFGAVCRSWRWVAQRCCTPHQFPWLLLKDCKSDYFFFSLSDGMTHTLHIPEARGMIIRGAFEGWLVMQSSIVARRRKFFLIDPLSKAKIHLPITATAINDAVNQQTVPVPILFAVHLSSAPISNDGAINNNCLAVGISVTNNLYLCRLGDQSWTRQDFIEAQDFKFREIIFHNGSFIAIDCWAWGQVRLVELVLESDHHLKLRAKMHSLPLPVFGDPDDEDNFQPFDSYRNLIEWRGELYFVFHEMRGQKEETVALHVFKLDKLEARWDLAKVENIGDGAIFLVTTVPKCFSVKDFPPSLNLKGNCIYHRHRRSRSTNVFRIKDGKWELCPSLSSVQTKEDPFRWYWYAPKIRY